MIILRLAWRNLWRNPHRTWLTAMTLALGLALLLVFLGLGDGSHSQMIESAVRMGGGHVIVQHPDYQERAGIEQLLTADQVTMVLRWLAAQRPEATLVKRAFASGLASSADGATGVRVIAVEPELEERVSRFPRQLTAGGFLAADRPTEVVVGEGVARKLALRIGSKLVLMVQAAGTGELQSQLVRVRGILETGLIEFDQIVVLLPLATARQFFGLDGAAHQVAVTMSEATGAEALAAAGQKQFPELAVMSWREAMPQLRDFIRLDDAGSYLFDSLFFLIIAFMLLNTMLMSVLERSREFAFLHALGLTPEKRFIMVMCEAFFIAVLASCMGLVIGWLGHLYLHIKGLPLDLFYSGSVSAAGVVLDPVMYSQLSAERIVGAISVVFALALVLAVVPALKAARTVNAKVLG
jgi:putative ABC transport system permease protein